MEDREFNKRAFWVLLIIEIGYFIRSWLPSMDYYTISLSNYANYPLDYLQSIIEYIVFYFSITIGIYGIKDKKGLLKLFLLIQIPKLIVDIIPAAIPWFYGSNYIAPIINYFLLILFIIVVGNFVFNKKQNSLNLKKLIKPAVFCILATVFQYLILVIPVDIYSSTPKREGDRDGVFFFVISILQILIAAAAQFWSGYLLIKSQGDWYRSSNVQTKKSIIGVIIAAAVMMIIWSLNDGNVFLVYIDFYLNGFF